MLKYLNYLLLFVAFVAVGAAWGFAGGFATGWLTATLVNFFQATWPLMARMRHDASQSVDFLDRM